MTLNPTRTESRSNQVSTEPYTPEETEVATVWQAQYGDGDAGVGKTLRREGEESWARFIAKVRADALREAGAAVMGERLETETEAGNWLDERADRIEAGEA